MAFNISYNIAAVCILLFFYVYFRLQYSVDNGSNKYYGFLLFATLIASALDTATALTDSYVSSVPLGLNYFANSIYFVSTMVSVYALTLYVQALIPEEKRGRLLNAVNLAIAIAYSIFAMLNPVTKLIIYFSEDNVYTHGPLYLIIYLAPLYYLVFTLIRLLFIRKMLTRRQFISVLLFVVFVSTGVVSQILFFKTTLISYFCCALGVMIIIFTFETPDYPKLLKTTEELRKSQKLLEDANEREKEMTKTLHQLMKSASWALYMDEKGNMKEAVWSDEFFKLLGYDPKDYKGETANVWQENLHPDDMERVVNSFIGGMQGVQYNEEHRLRSADGSYHWYRGSGEPKYDENGRMTSYQGVIQNIDEEKEKERLVAERLQALEELEKSQDELRRTLFLAEEASRAKTTFLSNMSHDIRTPMNAIVGFTDLAMAHVDDAAEVEDCLGTIRTSANHLLSLINDVLDMSRIESGKVKMEPTPCDMKLLLKELKSMVQSNVLEKRQAYVEDYSGLQDNYVMCDRLRMNQILLNCIGNSIKFTPEGGRISIRVEQETTAREGYAYYIIRIADNGIGMSRQFLEHVFEPFEREKSSTISKTQGTGLGMAITKNLVEMMGGTIVIDSAENVGTTYTITMPLRILTEEEKKEVQEQGKVIIPTEELVKNLQGRKFLVVDDNAVNRKIVNRLLTEMGMMIEEAQSGAEAIERLKDMKPGDIDMIFMDIQMPDMNGYETTDRLRKLGNPALETIPILAMTANAFEEDKQEAARHGMAGHIAKPFKLDTLIATIGPLLQ